METVQTGFYKNSSYTCSGSFAMGREQSPLNYVAIITLLLESPQRASSVCIGPQSAFSMFAPSRFKCPLARWARSVWF